MADVAKMLISGAQQSIKETTPDFNQALIQGSQLAARAEQAQLARQKLEEQKKQLQIQKIGKFTDTLLKVDKIKNPRDKKLFLSKFMPKNRDALGLQDVFSDDQISFLAGSDENLLKFKGLISRVQRGDLSFEQSLAIAQNPDLFADFELGPIEANELLGAEEGALVREAQKEKFLMQQQGIERRAQETRQQQLELRKQADLKEISKRIVSTGFTDTVNTLKKLDNLIPNGIDNFKKGDLPGKGSTGNLPDFMISAEGKELRQVSAELRNSILKLRSGGAVTPEEAKRLLEELGMSEGILPQFKSDKQFVDGIKRVRDKVRDKLAGIEAGFQPDVISDFQAEFRKRTGDVISSQDPFLSGQSVDKREQTNQEQAKPKQGREKLGKLTLDKYISYGDDVKNLIQQKTGLSDDEILKFLKE